MASDLMCSIPPGVSPTTLSSSSFVSTSTPSKRTYRGWGRDVVGGGEGG